MDQSAAAAVVVVAVDKEAAAAADNDIAEDVALDGEVVAVAD